MHWQKLTARSKPKAPCVLAYVWRTHIEYSCLILDQRGLDETIHHFRRDYNRYIELPEVK
jgi:hypothetical protein